MSSPKLATYQSEPSVEKTQPEPPWNRTAVLSSSPASKQPQIGVFPPLVSATTTENPAWDPETPSLSVLGVPVWIHRCWHCCQSGSTPIRTLRAHLIGSYAPLSATWLANAAVNHASCPGTRITCCSSLSVTPFLLFSSIIQRYWSANRLYVSRYVWKELWETTGEATKVHFI